jgi:hypothetical protein
MIKKHGRFLWIDIRIDGKRVRRSLKTESKFEALDPEAGLGRPGGATESS